VLRARDRKPYKGAWNPARVLERDPAGGRVRVRYHLRPDLEEEWVPMDRRSVRPAPEVAGGVLPAEDGGDADDGSDDPARPETPVPVTAARCAESHSWMMGWDMTCRHRRRARYRAGRPPVPDRAGLGLDAGRAEATLRGVPSAVRVLPVGWCAASVDSIRQHAVTGALRCNSRAYQVTAGHLPAAVWRSLRRGKVTCRHPAARGRQPTYKQSAACAVSPVIRSPCVEWVREIP
jgi:hypothetical protein